ncbi:MAG: A/G-specific adenine glycosylase, partial [Planctomycetota bacterium]|nr:A/G-specific adenine glycosylase [Planctomycetota bacterium]
MKPTTLSRALCRWFQQNGRDLPWRRNRDRYRVWVSEIMLQQTRIETVIPYYRKFLRKFPSVRALSRAPLSDVLKAWEGLGYYARARNLHKAAQILQEEHKGILPEDSDDWLTLPGIGEYTAAAIASITMDEPTPVVDGNVQRVISRILNEPAPPKEIVEYFLYELIDEKTPGDFNQGLMELGQTICTPRNPRCPDCPIKRGCDAYEAGTVDEIPQRNKPREIPHYEIAVGVCRKGKKFLVARRKEDGFLGGLWEFPGGKIRKKETTRRALLREFR